MFKHYLYATNFGSTSPTECTPDAMNAWLESKFLPARAGASGGVRLRARGVVRARGGGSGGRRQWRQWQLGTSAHKVAATVAAAAGSGGSWVSVRVGSDGDCRALCNLRLWLLEVIGKTIPRAFPHAGRDPWHGWAAGLPRTAAGAPAVCMCALLPQT